MCTETEEIGPKSSVSASARGVGISPADIQTEGGRWRTPTAAGGGTMDGDGAPHGPGVVVCAGSVAQHDKAGPVRNLSAPGRRSGGDDGNRTRVFSLEG